MLPALIFLGPLAVANANSIPLITFDGGASTTFPWEAVNDPVMGGQSTSHISIGANVAHWAGEVKLVPFLKAPGFCTIRTKGEAKFPDVSETSKLVILARNNASSALDMFSLQIETKGGTQGFRHGTYSGNVSIPATGEWVEVSSPFADFELAWRGEPMQGPKLIDQLDQIQQVGLSTFFPGKVGAFDMDIQYFKAE